MVRFATFDVKPRAPSQLPQVRASHSHRATSRPCPPSKPRCPARVRASGRRRRRFAAMCEKPLVIQRVELPATLLLAPGKRDSDSRRAVSDSNRSRPRTRSRGRRAAHGSTCPRSAQFALPHVWTRTRPSASKYRASVLAGSSKPILEGPCRHQPLLLLMCATFLQTSLSAAGAAD